MEEQVKPEAKDLNSKAREIFEKYGHIIRLSLFVVIILTAVIVCAFAWQYMQNIELIKQWAGTDLQELCTKTLAESFAQP